MLDNKLDSGFLDRKFHLMYKISKKYSDVEEHTPQECKIYQMGNYFLQQGWNYSLHQDNGKSPVDICCLFNSRFLKMLWSLLAVLHNQY